MTSRETSSGSLRPNEKTKSKLLKDVLAFANSWRQETAYVLIGVDEVQGLKSKVVGVTHHLDDADLQQFVNSKTQRPVAFSYRASVLEGKDVGVISVPVQERPAYISRKYGIVEKETVYLRRGSSNAVATPDEVARMGVVGIPIPERLELRWADLEAGRTKASPLAVDTAFLWPLLPEDAFVPQRSAGLLAGIGSQEDPGYSSKLIEFTFWSSLLVGLGLRIENRGDVVARSVRLVASIGMAEGILVRTQPPEKPTRNYWNSLAAVPKNALLAQHDPDPEVQRFDDRWEVTVEFGDVRPHDEVWTTSPLLLGSKTNQGVALVGELRGDNLSTPVPCRLEVDFTVESREMRRADARRHLEV